MGKGQGKGRGASDELSDEGEFASEPVWPPIVAAVLAGIFVIQVIAIIVIAASAEDRPTCTQPADITGYTVTETELSTEVGFAVTAQCAGTFVGTASVAACTTAGPYSLTGCTAPAALTREDSSAAGNGDAGDVMPPPPPPPPPPPTEDRRIRVSQFVNSANELSSVDQLDYFVTPRFQVTFGSGCSIVGGGVFCGEGTYDLEGFKNIIRDNLASGSNTQLIHTYGQGGTEVAGTVTDHYRVGGSGAHGAIIYHFNRMEIDEIFFYADAGEHVRKVEGFYAIVDNCGSDIDACNAVGEMYGLDNFLGPNYIAVFGPGTAKVGGATHSSTENDLMDANAFKEFVLSAPARCDGVSCPADLERTYVVEGDTVVNHYIARDPSDPSGEPIHAVAVHEFINGNIAESYWYTEHISSDCAPPTHEESIVNFLERIDRHFLPDENSDHVAFDDLNLYPDYVHIDYQAVFGPGCVLVGRNQRCGPTEMQMDADELEEFVDGRGKLFPGGDDYVSTCVHDLLTTVANNASVPECTKAWSVQEMTHMTSCTSVHLQSLLNTCVDNQIMSDGDTVVDTYEYKCGLDAPSNRCNIDTFLPRGVVVHEFDGSKIASSYWYNN